MFLYIRYLACEDFKFNEYDTCPTNQYQFVMNIKLPINNLIIHLLDEQYSLEYKKQTRQKSYRDKYIKNLSFMCIIIATQLTLA